MGDNGGIEALLRELIMGFPAWTKASELSSREIVAELKEMREKPSFRYICSKKSNLCKIDSKYSNPG